MDTDAWNRKHGRSTILGKEMFLDLNESREGVCRRGRGRSYTKISTAIYNIAWARVYAYFPITHYL